MTKKSEMSPNDCIYDKDGCKMRAAAVCVRDESESEVLLVTSFRKTNYWVVPAGKVEIGEDHGACAMREAMEESAAVGRLGRYLGQYEHQDRGIKKRTFVYVLYVDSLLDDYQEKERRRRAWFSLDDAFAALNSYKAQQSEYLVALLASRTAAPSSCGNGNGEPRIVQDPTAAAAKLATPNVGNGQSLERLAATNDKNDVT